MQRASTVENSSFNSVLLKYLWRTTAVLGQSKSICLTVKIKQNKSLKFEHTQRDSSQLLYEYSIHIYLITNVNAF